MCSKELSQLSTESSIKNLAELQRRYEDMSHNLQESRMELLKIKVSTKNNFKKKINLKFKVYLFKYIYFLKANRDEILVNQAEIQRSFMV